jgi:hexulose-6-phosphate isomerase
MNRRSFLRSTAALAATAPFASSLSAQSAPAGASAAAAPSKAKRKNPKGFMFATLNSETSKKLSLREKFQLLRDAGFAGVEPSSAMNQAEVLAARDATGLQIPSVVIATHWAKPLSDPNPATRQIGLDGLLHGLRDAKAYGASSVLLVPGTVTKQVSYTEAFTRSAAEIKKAVPLAEELGVVIAIELLTRVSVIALEFTLTAIATEPRLATTVLSPFTNGAAPESTTTVKVVPLQVPVDESTVPLTVRVTVAPITLHVPVIG